MRMRTLASFLVALWVAACGGGDPDTTPVTLARTITYQQCRPVTPLIAESDAALAAAGVQILARGCAYDGATFPALCDSPATVLRSVDVPAHQEGLARALGYKAPGEFSTFLPASCPAV